MFKKLIALLLAAAMVPGLAACAGKPAETETNAVSVKEDVTTDAGTAAGSDTETDTGPEPQQTPEDGLTGTPWITSSLTGNLPASAPDAKDDLFLHYNYDEIAAHQGEFYASATANAAAVTDYISAAIENGTLKAPENGKYTENEIKQLQIFYRQASDLAKLEEDGVKDLQPYLDRIMAVSSVEELNAVLVSDDFPFCPYLFLPVGAYDMSGENNVLVYPEFMLVDNLDGAGYYLDTDDEVVKAANKEIVAQSLVSVMETLKCIGISDEEKQAAAKQIYAFEKSYGKDAGSLTAYMTQPHGAFGKASENLSLDELAALCPNYPVKETVIKFGKGESPFYTVLEKKWLSSFNSVWTDENIDVIKLTTAAKILKECTPYLDPKVTDPAREMLGQPAMDAQTNAIEACNQNETFAQLIGKIYLSDNYTDQDVEKLTSLSNELADSFRDLIASTSWLDEASREKMTQKLDNMIFCLLAPEEGYLDFSGLSLTPTEEGGTLVSNYLKIKDYINGKINERIGKPAVAQFMWEYCTPSTVNCFYDQDSNTVNVTIGFAAGGMYDRSMTREELLSGIGWVIAHEISHGFDFAGSQFDAYGRGNSIYTEENLNDFLAITDRVVKYYDTFEPLPGVKINGNTVKVEACADLIGLQLVLHTAKKSGDVDYEALFKRAANIYCVVYPSADVIETLIGGDVHPQNIHRTNVNVQMFDEFYKTYGVKEGDGMYLKPEDRIIFFGE